MRVSSKGDVTIPKVAWYILAATHRAFARQLTELMLATQGDSPARITEALAVLQGVYTAQADTYFEVAKKTKPGRPRTTADPPKEIVGIIADAVRTKSTKPSPGRPAKRPKNWDRLVFERVEAKYAELARNKRTKPTIRAAIELLLRRDVAKAKGVSEISAVNMWTGSTTRAYYRAKKSPAKKMQN